MHKAVLRSLIRNPDQSVAGRTERRDNRASVVWAPTLESMMELDQDLSRPRASRQQRGDDLVLRTFYVHLEDVKAVGKVLADHGRNRSHGYGQLAVVRRLRQAMAAAGFAFDHQLLKHPASVEVADGDGPVLINRWLQAAILNRLPRYRRRVKGNDGRGMVGDEGLVERDVGANSQAQYPGLRREQPGGNVPAPVLTSDEFRRHSGINPKPGIHANHPQHQPTCVADNREAAELATELAADVHAE